MADKESALFLSSAHTPLSGDCLMSAYHKSLSGHLQINYADKLQEVNIADPFGMRKQDFNVEPERWPKVTFADIYFYLVNSTSIFTHSQMKAYKNLDAYQFVVTDQTYDVMCICLLEKFRPVFVCWKSSTFSEHVFQGFQQSLVDCL